MAMIGDIELLACKELQAGGKTTISSLFSISERSKEYQLRQNIKEGAKIKVTIAKVEPFETTADATVKEGKKVSAWRLVKYPDFNSRELVASEDIRDGDPLKITYKAL